MTRHHFDRHPLRSSLPTARAGRVVATGLLLFLAALARPALAQSEPSPSDAELRQLLTEASDARVSYRIGVAELVSNEARLAAFDGSAEVELSALGAELGVHQLVRVHIPELRWQGLALGAVELELWRSANAPEATLDVRVHDGLLTLDAALSLDLRLDAGRRELVWADGPVTGSATASLNDLGAFTRLVGLPFDGVLSLQASLGGSSTEPQIELTAEIANPSWEGTPLPMFAASWRHDAGQSTLQARLGPLEAFVGSLELELPLSLDLHGLTMSWRDAEPARLAVELPSIDAAFLRPWYRLPVGVETALAFSLSGGGSLDAFRLDGKLAGELQREGIEPLPLAVELVVEAAEQQVSARLGDDEVVLALSTAIPFAGLRRGTARMDTASLAGELALALPLQTLAPFVATGLDTLEGALQGSVAISGSLGAPSFDGSLSLADGAVTVLALNRRLKKLALDAQIAGDTLTLASLTAESEPGTLSGTGSLRWQATGPKATAEAPLWSAWRLDGELVLTLDAFPFVQEGFPVGLLTGEMAAVLEAEPNTAELALTLGASELNLTSEELPKTVAIPTNNAVAIVDPSATDEAMIVRPRGRWVLSVALAEPLAVRGPAAEVDLVGKLILTREEDLVRVDGGFTTKPGGWFELFENRFDVRVGQVSLAEGVIGASRVTADGSKPPRDPNAAPEAAPLEPIAEIVAHGYVVDTYVLVKVHGPMRRPELVLASIPAVPEYEIMTLLVTGRVDAVDERNGNVRRQVAKLVERYHNPSLKRQLFDRLGVDNLGLGFGASVANPILTVGKQLTRPLYVETVYHHAAPPDTNMMEGHVEYRLGSEWSFDTVFGEAGEGSFGVFWKTSFGGPPLPEPPDEGWGLSDPTARRADDDDDDVPNPFDRCRFIAEDRDDFHDDDGCPDPDNDGDGIPDELDAAPLEAESFNGFEDADGAPDVAPQALVDYHGTVRSMPFDSGEAQLPPEAERIVRACLSLAGSDPAVRIIARGHSDDIGDERKRQRVSERRAESVVSYLRGQQLPAERLQSVGMGSSQPLVDGDDEVARARNRRVEIELLWEPTLATLPANPDAADLAPPQ
ncbi:MAG: translocation/assembly module TamB domain-containing protein [Myxococcota bacterium]|jgi:outer membrane protein OmpA-like peptidoglycan-associated protein|nr:translocation/assembly module TamB domain-containing protein [Myxococcota bacterium]